MTNTLDSIDKYEFGMRKLFSIFNICMFFTLKRYIIKTFDYIMQSLKTTIFSKLIISNNRYVLTFSYINICSIILNKRLNLY